MKPYIRAAMAVAALSLAAVPAMAAANPPSTVPPENQGTAHHQANTQGPNYNPAGNPNPGPNASLPAKAKAYGVYCRNESKKHVAGQKGTPFSQCVTAMAKLNQADNNSSEEEKGKSSLSPGQACKGESRKHVAGQKGTPFSQCVVAAAKLRHHEQQEEGEGS